jgi:hypothetical protein
MRADYAAFIKLVSSEIRTELRHVSDVLPDENACMDIICYAAEPITYKKYFPKAFVEEAKDHVKYIYPANTTIGKFRAKHDIVITVHTNEEYVNETLRKRKVCVFLTEIDIILCQALYLKSCGKSTSEAFTLVSGMPDLFDTQFKTIRREILALNRNYEILKNCAQKD